MYLLKFNTSPEMAPGSSDSGIRALSWLIKKKFNFKIYLMEPVLGYLYLFPINIKGQGIIIVGFSPMTGLFYQRMKKVKFKVLLESLFFKHRALVSSSLNLWKKKKLRFVKLITFKNKNIQQASMHHLES